MKKLFTITAAVLTAAIIATGSVQSGELGNFARGRTTMGVGFGIPYGVVGTNMDIQLVDNLKLSFGLGSTVLAGAGYNFGLKYFLGEPGKSFRPRFSVFYGTNAVLQTVGGGDPYDYDEYYYDEYYYYKAGKVSGWGNSSLAEEYKSYSGVTLGFGGELMFGASKANGLDFDIMYVATTGYDLDELRSEGYNVAETGKVKISLGYRHAF